VILQNLPRKSETSCQDWYWSEGKCKLLVTWPKY